MNTLSLERQRDIDAFVSMVAERLGTYMQALVEEPPESHFSVAELRRGSLSRDLVLLAMIVERKLYLLRETHQTVVQRVFVYLDTFAPRFPDEHKEVQVVRHIQTLVNQARLCVTDMRDLLLEREAAELMGISVPTLFAHVERHDLHPVMWHGLEVYDRDEVLTLQHSRMRASSPQGTGGDVA